MKSPHVQRALRDPGISSALYQNFRDTGGEVPQLTDPSQVQAAPQQQPFGMQNGGGVPTPEDINRLDQVRGGDVDPETADELEDLAQQSRPARFQGGGGNTTDIDVQIAQATADLNKATQAQNQSAINDANARLITLNNKKRELSTPSPSGPTSLGNMGQVSGQTMSGVQKLGQQGPATLGNTAAAAGLGAVLGLGGSQGRGSGALIGAATAGLLNYFVRKNQQKRQQQQQQQNDTTGGFQGDRPGVTPAPSGSSTPAPQGPPPAPLPSGPGLWTGTANVRGGNVTSSDGKSWQDASGNSVPAAQVANQTQVKSFDQPQASDDIQNLPTQSRLPSLQQMGNSLGAGALDDAALEDSEDTGLKKGGPVKPTGIAAALPHGMPVPILHTTIVIAAKPKKGAKEEKPIKRSMGGDIPQSERRPRRPHAIPPIAGPESSGARLPHGRVQVPRGSGAAIKGKRFGGVF